MATAQRNLRIVLEGEDDESYFQFEAIFEPINKQVNLARIKRTISIEPFVDAPIIPIKSTEIIAENTTTELNIAALIIAGVMIGSICFGGGYILATAQYQTNTLEARR